LASQELAPNRARHLDDEACADAARRAETEGGKIADAARANVNPLWRPQVV
jgi:hypothetical protein